MPTQTWILPRSDAESPVAEEELLALLFAESPVVDLLAEEELLSLLFAEGRFDLAEEPLVLVSPLGLLLLLLPPFVVVAAVVAVVAPPSFVAPSPFQSRAMMCERS